MTGDTFTEKFLDERLEGSRCWEGESGEGDVGGLETAVKRGCVVGLW